jgi:quercetin dioxygenase-like cupin family protein
MKNAVRTGGTAVVMLAMVAVCAAQAPSFKRTELQRADLSGGGREAVTAVAEIPDGATSGRHTHPGEEIGYVLEGTMSVEIDGKPPMTMKAGQAFSVPAGLVHNAKHAGKGTSRVLVTYIIEKGKPVTSPVQ